MEERQDTKRSERKQFGGVRFLPRTELCEYSTQKTCIKSVPDILLMKKGEINGNGKNSVLLTGEKAEINKACSDAPKYMPKQVQFGT